MNELLDFESTSELICFLHLKSIVVLIYILTREFDNLSVNYMVHLRIVLIKHYGSHIK
jgi:hypothetical protein